MCCASHFDDFMFFAALHRYIMLDLNLNATWHTELSLFVWDKYIYTVICTVVCLVHDWSALINRPEYTKSRGCQLVH